MQKMAIDIVNRSLHMKMKLYTLYRNIWFIHEVIAEVFDNMIILNRDIKRPVTVEVPVSIYDESPGKWNKG